MRYEVNHSDLLGFEQADPYWTWTKRRAIKLAIRLAPLFSTSSFVVVRRRGRIILALKGQREPS